MLSKNDLISGDVQATDDMEGVNDLLQKMHNSIIRKHMKVTQLFEEDQVEEATKLRETLKELHKECDSMMKSQMTYQKFLEHIGKGDTTQKKTTGMLKALKEEKSSNGNIVGEVPKSTKAQ